MKLAHDLIIPAGTEFTYAWEHGAYRAEINMFSPGVFARMFVYLGRADYIGKALGNPVVLVPEGDNA